MVAADVSVWDVLTAVFTGLTVIVAWLLYRHGRILSGTTRPIQAREEGPGLGYVSGLHGSGDAVAGFLLYNRSDAPETVSLGNTKHRVLWPRGCEVSQYSGGWVDIPSRHRHAFVIRLARRDGQAFPKRRAWVLVYVKLTRGKYQRFLRRVTAYQ